MPAQRTVSNGHKNSPLPSASSPTAMMGMRLCGASMCRTTARPNRRFVRSCRAQQGDDRRFACFTFDDGYRDNRQYAYPLFKRRSLPLTLYAPTDFPDGRGELWWLALEEIVACDRDRALPWRRALEASRRDRCGKDACLRGDLLVVAPDR
jgi:hypothetical protein